MLHLLLDSLLVFAELVLHRLEVLGQRLSLCRDLFFAIIEYLFDRFIILSFFLRLSGLGHFEILLYRYNFVLVVSQFLYQDGDGVDDGRWDIEPLVWFQGVQWIFERKQGQVHNFNVRHPCNCKSEKRCETNEGSVKMKFWAENSFNALIIRRKIWSFVRNEGSATSF